MVGAASKYFYYFSNLLNMELVYFPLPTRPRFHAELEVMLSVAYFQIAEVLLEHYAEENQFIHMRCPTRSFSFYFNTHFVCLPFALTNFHRKVQKQSY
jgi:hypothetical protein